MATNDHEGEEPMETDQSDIVSSKDEVLLVLSLEWVETDKPERRKNLLQKSLQSWLNKRHNMGDCSVERILEDGWAEIKIKSSTALKDLQKLNNETLTTNQGDKVATVKSINLGFSKPVTQTSHDATGNPSSSSVAEIPADKSQLEEWSGSFSAAGNTSVDDKRSSQECLIPVVSYMYVSHIHKEKIKRIEEQWKVKITFNVSVKFEAEQEDGKPIEAQSEFTNLVQKCIPESSGSIIPLKFVDPDQSSDVMRLIKDKEKKLLITMSSEEITVLGPSESQKALSAILNATQNTDTPPEDYDSASPSTLLKMDMTIKDPLVDEGLTMFDDCWKFLERFCAEQVLKIKTKFNVDFKDSRNSQGKVNVKAFYKGPGGNAAMESHAVRALQHLYQKKITSPLSFTQPAAAAGVSSLVNLKAFNGPALNGDSSQQRTDTPIGGGATAADSEDERCPICLDSFKNKKQLKCKHEFCEQCLHDTKKHSGPICPICKDVFGVMKGDQPRGNMTWSRLSTPLPGYSDCGHIVITYCIPSGKQTEKHPNPGQPYHGTSRIAYLPNNKEGEEVLQLLKKAFDQKLIFTIGSSRTTGMENQVTWNDIHHKTSIHGGPESFGYPDPSYLSRVKEELKAKGIK